VCFAPESLVHHLFTFNLIVKMFASILLSFHLLLTSLQGKVKDTNTGLPVSSAQVSISPNDKATISDSLGNFEFQQLNEGKYKITIQAIGYDLYEQEITLTSQSKQVEVFLNPIDHTLEEVTVESIRASKKNATTFTTIQAKDIALINQGQDLPVLLNYTPSVVSTTNSGIGIGYTGIRIRGTDADRINVTINGVPLNDAESHGTFWVNMPDLASSIGTVQIQRGVGTSSNGAAAFGGSVNIQTNNISKEPYGMINSSLGSFNTFKNTFQAGTGLINNKFAFETRLSKITSDGFVDRAFSDLKSFYASGAYFGKKSLLKAIVLSGKQTTYQAWYGVPEDTLKAGNRTYNIYTYPNQTDNYQQDYYQLHYTYELSKKLNFNTALFYTRGRGYYEEFREGDSFQSYNLQTIVRGTDTTEKSDFVRQKWLDNHFYGLTFSANYQHEKTAITIGGGANQYLGEHFGKLLWSKDAANTFNINDKYYDNNATKNDYNFYTKYYYQIWSKLNLFADLQWRYINYNFLGINQKLEPLQQSVDYLFFNPKAGFTYDFKPNHYWYTSFSIGQKEPTRNDFVIATPNQRPQSEKLYNLESGIRGKRGIWNYGANLYWMQYENQLVLTGKLNDVGDPVRQNVSNSHRAGLELEGGVQIGNKLRANLNFTMSRNKIEKFEEYLYDYGDNFQEIINVYSNTNIAFSPSLIAGGMIQYSPITGLHFALMPKYVGEQYLDNTSNDSRKLNAYEVVDARITYELPNKLVKNLNFTLLVNNILNKKYESNGATYPYYVNQSLIQANYFFPQAGTHYYVGISMKF
jgi:iron complex outermembrane receptor protein